MIRLNETEIQQLAPGCDGGFLLTVGDEVTGWAAFTETELNGENVFWASHWQADERFPLAASSVCQALRKEARERGYKEIWFDCKPDSPTVKLILSGRATAERIIARMEL